MSDFMFTLLGGLCFFLAAACIVISVFGVFKFRFVMNRMHCAALLDTLGLSLILLGLILLVRDSAFVPKLLLILLIQWIGSPIASHMVGRLEVRTDKELSAHVSLEESEENDELH